MKTAGFLTDTLFYLRTLTTLSVLSIGLQMCGQANSTSDVSTFGNSESLEIRIGESSLRATGSDTTGALDELNQERVLLGNDQFRREILSVQPTKGKVNFEETRQLFLNSVLTECLTDGTPAYYNSNILGRYYRKDYHDFGDSPGTDTD